MAIFNLNFLLKVGQVEMCQNPSPISTGIDIDIKRLIKNRKDSNYNVHFLEIYSSRVYGFLI